MKGFLFHLLLHQGSLGELGRLPDAEVDGSSKVHCSLFSALANLGRGFGARSLRGGRADWDPMADPTHDAETPAPRAGGPLLPSTSAAAPLRAQRRGSTAPDSSL